MEEWEKKKLRRFYAIHNKILKEENLCTGCFLPKIFCQNECQKIKIKDSCEFWKRRANLFQEKLFLCCLRKRKIIGDLCRDYASATGKDFYHNEFLIFISKQIQNERSTKTRDLEKESKIVLPRKQRNIQKRKFVPELLSSEFDL